MRSAFTHLALPRSRALALALLSLSTSVTWAFVSQSDAEFFSAGDFNGDGRLDVIVVDRATAKIDYVGRYRVAYQSADGQFQWTRARAVQSGMLKISGVAVGRLLDPKKDAVAFTTPDANQVAVYDVGDPAVAPEPVAYLGLTLGPSAVIAVDIGGDDNTPHADLCVGSIFNEPAANHVEYLRNDGSSGTPLEDVELTGELTRGNAIRLKQGGAWLAAGIITGETNDTFQAVDLSTGKPVTALAIVGLPRGTEYAVGFFGKSATATLFFYAGGQKNIEIRPLTEAQGKFTAGAAVSFPTERGIKQLLVSGAGESARLIALLGNGDTAEVFGYDGQGTPKSVQTIPAAEDQAFSGVVAVGETVMAMIRRPPGRLSTMYQVRKPASAGLTATPTAETSVNDDAIHPIHELMKANLSVTSEAEMKPYTNTIPGTKISFAMLPVKGGEFLMGTPEGEDERAAAEGPQRKVKIAPFWMGRCEVTWDEYTLFMYHDEEFKFKETIPTDPKFDAASEACGRPSKPYTEMSFGMGREGYPAISMTHHAASKYCQWLSAKTGHFYRLPTEAEWEYACRAGTTTAYSFGADADALEDYAVFEDNSDFKYAKVGTKKPNPWGFHDLHGNVLEWCLDQMAEDYSKVGATENPWVRSTKPYPHVTRGGSYDDSADRLRSGARRGSRKEWKMTDPQLPKSTWWLSDAKWVGFRIVRPLRLPDAEEAGRQWNSEVHWD